MHLKWGTRGVAPIAALLAIATTNSAVAQAPVALPELTVTAPSPIVRAPRASQLPVAASPAQQAAPVFQPPPGLVEQVFAPLTVVAPPEILATGGANLADALQYQPGIAASTFAPGASRPIIRGLDNTRVSVRENGLGAHDASTLSEDHAVPIDPFAADQIEVVRGPATLRYGSSAIGGAVNATNQRIPDFIPRNGFTAETRGAMASADRSAEGAFKTTSGAGNFAVHADSFWRRAEDYAVPGGQRQANSFVDSNGFSTGGSVIGQDGFVGLSFTQYNSLYGIPGARALTNRTRIDMQQEKVQSRGEWRVRDYGVEAIRYWLGSSTYRHNEVGFETGAAEIGSRFSNNEVEGRVEVQHLPVDTALGELRGAFGVQAGHRTLSGLSFEGDNLLDPANTRTRAVFWFEELQLTRNLRLQAATRVEQVFVSGRGLDLSDPFTPTLSQVSRAFVPFSSSFGALYQLPAQVVARATAQYAERAPDAAELFSKGAHEATETFEVGNPNLRKEVAKSFEMGLKRSQGAFRFDTSIYHTIFDGFIFKQRTGDTCGATFASCGPAGGDLNQVFFQQRNAAFTGMEISAQQDIGKFAGGVWGVDAQYDLVRATFTDAPGGNVPRIPPHRAGAGVFYRDAHLHVRTGFLHAFDQRQISENETMTKGFTLLNADVSYTWKTNDGGNQSTEMTVGLKGTNLLDQDVRNHASFQKDNVLQPGRSVKLYGTMRLN